MSVKALSAPQPRMGVLAEPIVGRICSERSSLKRIRATAGPPRRHARQG